MNELPKVPYRHSMNGMDYVYYDDYESLRAVAEHLLAENEALQMNLKEEIKIVDRIWDLFGRPTYGSLGGKSIYDLIAGLQAENEALRKADK